MRVLSKREIRTYALSCELHVPFAFSPLNALIGAVGVAIERFKYSHAPLPEERRRREGG